MNIPEGFKVTQLNMETSVVPIRGTIPDTNWEQKLSNGKVAKWVEDENNDWKVTNCHLKEIPKENYSYYEDDDDWVAEGVVEVWVENDDETKVIEPKYTSGIVYVQGPLEIYGKYSSTTSPERSLKEMVDNFEVRTHKFDFEYLDDEHGNIKLLGIMVTSEYQTAEGTIGTFCCDKAIRQK